MYFLLARAGLGCALSTLGFASTLACPTNDVASIVSDGEVRIGDNTTITQNRLVGGTQVQIGIGGGASNGVASIMSGDGTVVVQTGCVDGPQVDVVVGAGGRAPNGKTPAPSGRVRGSAAADTARDCRRSGTTIRVAPGAGAMPKSPGSDAQTIDIRPGCAPTTGQTR